MPQLLKDHSFNSLLNKVLSSQGYDIEALLDKQLQPMICYVRECSKKQQHGNMTTSSFNLEQIQIQY